MEMPEWAHLQMEEIDFQAGGVGSCVALLGHRLLFKTEVEEEEAKP